MPGMVFGDILLDIHSKLGVAINVDQVYCFMCEPYHEKSFLESTSD